MAISLRERLLAATAASVLALMLTPPVSASSQPADDAAINARVPVPDPVDLPPLTARDIDAPATPKAETAAPVTPNDTPAQNATAPAAPAAAPAQATAPAMPAAPAIQTAAPVDLPADQPLRDKIAEIVGKGLAKQFDRKNERQGVEAFYTGRKFAPLWIDNGNASAAAKAAAARLHAADADGLDVADFATPDIASATSPDALAEAEIKMTAAVIAYVRQAQGGRTIPARITANAEYAPKTVDPNEVLSALATTKDIVAALDGYNPPHKAFRALREKLAELRAQADPATHIPSGPALKPGMDDPRVPKLREKLGLPAAENTVYDEALVQAVKAAQKKFELKATGVFDNRILDALNGPRREKQIDTILANMERWRWIPRDLGKAYVMVNVPDYSLHVMKGDQQIWQTRIVVGKPATPTPIFSDEIENIVVNPTWHVPESIVYNEYLPALQQDSTVLARMGLNVRRAADGSVTITQPPGDGNALGRMKFNFPNRFNVYLHDTPDKRLFALDKRAFSHGCMRVQDPPKFGEMLASLALPQKYTADGFRRMFGSGEQWLKFSNFVPVHITYQTAFVDEAGKLVIRPDLYGLDNRVEMALRGEYRRIADGGSAPSTSRKKKQLVRQAVDDPRPEGFLERLFR